MKFTISLVILFLSTVASSEWKIESKSGVVLGYRGTQLIPPGQGKIIALTFDDGPGPGTALILDALKEFEHDYGIQLKATFFSIGKNADANPKLLKRIVAEGHLLANHTSDHCDLSNTLVPRKQSNICDVDPSLIYGTHAEFVRDQVLRTHEILKNVLPAKGPFFFRAPHGFWLDENSRLLNQDPDLKQYIGPIHWTVGGEVIPNAKMLERVIDVKHLYPSDIILKAAADWQCWSKEFRFTTEHCLSGYQMELATAGGGVVLMHDIYKQTAEMVKLWLPQLIADGYQFVRIDETPLMKKILEGTGR